MDAATYLCIVCALLTLIPAWFGPDDAWLLAVLSAFSVVPTICAWHVDQLCALSVLDLLTLGVGVVLYASQPAPWRAAFAVLAACQLGLDTVYEAIGNAIYGVYAALYNGCFLAQLVLLAGTGASDGWDVLYRSRRRRRG